MILDSNIIIYSALPESERLREFISEHSPNVSAISRLEVLGYPDIEDEDKDYFAGFFTVATVIPIETEIIDGAIALRDKRKMSLGDALIAATALEHRLTLVTRNTKDFKWIDSLTLINPFAEDE
ncbi:MAG: type II toxin-antitoxin system VapC family toxin [Pyrinomonadaceae bacterium]|nr:type II toxin-antitoxin system VapC family toxin [Acidobacteriota bacterium]MBP7476518.1 type II toxin-antitoxin system VapC family toxin [Pyrinomonadaceae bacterium]MBP9111094.1 type II toxin-antitoxin system VapC family toxin [Pyrinomonadaceae bacterium]